MKITKEMGIMEIVQKNEKCAEVLMNNGMHCLGCAASRFESLEQGCKAHGMDDEKINKIVKELNEVVESK